MGRQHTTWISDETWDRLQNIAGESVSKKISNAVKFADPEEQMRQNHLMRQFALAKKYLQMVAKEFDLSDFQAVEAILEECDWIWSADMDVKE